MERGGTVFGGKEKNIGKEERNIEFHWTRPLTMTLRLFARASRGSKCMYRVRTVQRFTRLFPLEFLLLLV